jgi:imidazole glycerol-phosphate synthase subunit HisF
MDGDMSKKRLIGGLFVRDGIVVQSRHFDTYQPVGHPEIAVRFLDDWGVDEIMMLDITARREGRTIDIDLVASCAATGHVPLCVGGGIATVGHVRDLVRAGADKIAINGLFFEDPTTVPRIVAQFGAQCVIGAMDVEATPLGPRVIDANHDTQETSPADWALGLRDLGVGEILVNNVDRDGAGTGYDLAVMNAVADAVSLPVIALGGACSADHVAALFANTRARAAAVGNALHYVEHSVSWLKSCLVRQGLDVRLDSQADYRHVAAGPDGRCARRDEHALIDEVFTFIPPEEI